jgi:hypothetical protein
MPKINIYLKRRIDMQRKQNKFRSNYEVTTANIMTNSNISWAYEVDRIDYVLEKKYCPDFKISDGIYVETKGVWDGEDRAKVLAVKKQHPEVEIIMCFQNPNLKIQKNSKTRYRDWSDKHGFIWCEANEKSIKEAIQKAYRKRWEFEE